MKLYKKVFAGFTAVSEMDEEDRMIARLQQRLWKRGLVEYKKEYREFYMPKNKPGAVKIPIIMPQDKSWRHNWAAVYDL